MKSLRVTFVVSILTLSVLSTVSAQSGTDYNSTTMIPLSEEQLFDTISQTPFTPSVRGVLWDITHGILLNYKPDGRFSALVSVINGLGLSVDTTSISLDNATFAGIDRMGNPTEIYSDSEEFAVDSALIANAIPPNVIHVIPSPTSGTNEIAFDGEYLWVGPFAENKLYQILSKFEERATFLQKNNL